MHWQRLKRFILKIRNVDRCTDFVCVCSKNSVGHMRNCRIQKKKRTNTKYCPHFFYAAMEFRSFFLKILCVCVVLRLGK